MTQSSQSDKSFVYGRVDNLNSEQEVVLKQLWAHLLNFWGYEVSIPTNQLSRTRTTASSTSTRTAAPGEKVEKEKKKKFGKLLGRKSSKSSSNGTPSSASSIKPTRRSSISLKHQASFSTSNYGDGDNKSIRSMQSVTSMATRSIYNQALRRNEPIRHEPAFNNTLQPIESVDTFVTAETELSEVGELPTFTPHPLSPSKSIQTQNSEANYVPSKVPSSKIHPSLRGLNPDEIQQNFWKMLRIDSPDNLLLRFIRARKFDTDKSLEMISKTLHWRLKTSHAEQVLSEGDLIPFVKNEAGVIKNFELFKSCIRGHDKHGRPIVVVRPRLHHAKDQTQTEMEKYTLLVIEYARLFLNEPTDSCSVLFDLTDFSLSNMDYAPVKFMIACFEAHYPESLGILLIHKAPWVFSGIWNIIKQWLDPVVASKINFTKSIKDVTKFIDIENIPDYLGGKKPFDIKYIKPSQAKDGIKVDNEKKAQIQSERDELIMSFIEATKHWIESTNPDDSEAYLAEKISLGKQLARNYVRLDPYIRSRGIYDRLGELTLTEDMIKD